MGRDKDGGLIFSSASKTDTYRTGWMGGRGNRRFCEIGYKIKLTTMDRRGRG